MDTNNEDNQEEKNGENIPSVKITLLGNSGVGKTCIISRYTKGDYTDNSTTTRGADYSQKPIKVQDQILNLDIWDTAGQEQYRSLGKHFYRDSFIVILVYDITNRESFEDLKNVWYNDLKKFGEKYTVLAIVGNKSDMFEQEVVNEEEGRKFAEEVNAIFMLVSAKNGDNIVNLFRILANKYLDPFFQDQIEEINQQNEGSVKIKKKSANDKGNKQNKRRGCC